MFEAMGGAGFGLRVGGTSDRITITAAKPQAAIRAALKPCDPLLMGEPVVGMLSDVQSKPNVNLANITTAWLLGAFRLLRDQSHQLSFR
jgi:hypothetical protein